ncbi:uncharacterized protein A1O9_01409 [Exophiala aquamarina CBS 119918]|uniref:FAD/NAD(P)-binding domain-containing protein n=1 Tax=Exophiala aquamarina CBS 119918 TaxID=1182545 RepID=A0A072PU99_9EURO|nr:uncharacterized protein A1O9_01409 [Exophiala aquamarina CBS 119918]KEF63431.1 hypothetical protein A1O9_01409 [Exophiala aquamarina CBS 119918]
MAAQRDAINPHQATNGISKRTPATPIADLPGTLPKIRIPGDVDCTEIATAAIAKFPSLLAEDLTDEAVWRDSLALTGNFRTFNTRGSILKVWKETSGQHSPLEFQIVPGTARIFRVGDQSSWVEAGFTFRTTTSVPQLSCSGYVSLIPDDCGKWRIWMLRTVLEQIDGVGNVDELEPLIKNGATDAMRIDPVVSSDGRSHHHSPQHFDVIVIGGGQAGLGVGGRLQALGVSYLIIDRHPAVGDSWNSRYDSTKLHTAREYGHLPFYRTYDASYPEFLGKTHVAAGHIDYVKRYGINIWQSTEMVSSSWSADRREWTCGAIQEGEEVTLTTLHLVFATGAGSYTPYMPIHPNREAYQGEVLHSATYTNPSKWKGKRGVIIGTANTAHDIADDMLREGLSSVTMVQRNRTWVLPVEHYMAVTVPSYNDKIPTEVADRRSFSMPLAILRQIAMCSLHGMAQRDSERYDALEKAGFWVERYGDIAHIMYERMGGHYMDVGTSEKIVKGLIKIKNGATPTTYTKEGLAFSDGTEVSADLIVFATGFNGNLRETVGKIVGPEIEDQLEDFWQLDSEGEIRGAFKDTGHPGVWYTGGAIGIARYYGRFIALQIKAQIMGTPLKVYTGKLK